MTLRGPVSATYPARPVAGGAWAAPARGWRTLAGLALLLLLTLLAAGPARAASPELSAAASFLLPGAGQAGNGDWAAAGGHFGLWLFLWRQQAILADQPDYLEDDVRVDDRHLLLHTNRTTFSADLYASAGINLALYSAYGAYRDAWRHEGGADFPPPQDQPAALALAPFRWEHLSRPTTFVPLLALAVGLAAADPDERYVFARQGGLTRDELALGLTAQMEMVAVGEESLFRGVINHSLSRRLGPRWGVGLSSVVFGLAHSGTGGTATPAAATLFGLYAGLLHQRNAYALGENVALHFWWNLLISAAALQTRDGDEEVTLGQFVMHF